MIRKILLTSFASLFFSTSLFAQWVEKKGFFSDMHPLSSLDLSVTAGTTGIGFDLATPLNDNIQLRMGAAFLPSFEKPMAFDVCVSYDETKTPEENMNSKENKQKFKKLSEMLEGFTGYQIGRTVDMIGEPHMNNFKLLVDVFPFQNKKWHVTAGFYVGGTHVAKAYNSTEAMGALFAVAMYNKMYDRTMAGEPLFSYGDQKFDPSPEMKGMLVDKFLEYGRMTVPLGNVSRDIIATEDVYYESDEWTLMKLDDGTYMEDELIHQKGDIKYHKGDVIYKTGDTYHLTPDDKNMVTADAKINAFKPYIGFGYGGQIDKSGLTSVSFDCGLMFWGGKPKIKTRTPIGVDATGKNTIYSEVDMTRDLYNIPGKAGDYVKLISNFVVYPVINLRISQKLYRK